MKDLKRFTSLLLALVLTMGLISISGNHEVQAATKPAKPVISLPETDKDGEFLIKIKKTKNADGYRIYCRSDKDKSYRWFDTITQNGKKIRKYTAKVLLPGTYSFRVRAYSKSGKETVWSEYSKVVKIKVTDVSSRVRNDLINEKASNEYPELYKLVEAGKIGLTMSEDNQIYFTMGSYDMIDQKGNYDGEKETIEWIVLDYDEDEGKALLLSRYCIDKKSYHSTTTSITWEECKLRSWLNEEFLKTTFSSAEQKLILLSEVRNEGYNSYGINRGNDTKDKIFLLSPEDCQDGKYFNSDEERKAMFFDGEACRRWWLRSPGSMELRAACVMHDGTVYYGFGNDVGDDDFAVRPALWINLNP
ncbi:MAG: fibronectin type III domain-containing protein [Lachnospiraceae bacterium]|nr:fibronectin type III domain-containing protein [Lachnospiraceae bacterium]